MRTKRLIYPSALVICLLVACSPSPKQVGETCVKREIAAGASLNGVRDSCKAECISLYGARRRGERRTYSKSGRCELSVGRWRSAHGACDSLAGGNRDTEDYAYCLREMHKGIEQGYQP